MKIDIQTLFKKTNHILHSGELKSSIQVDLVTNDSREVTTSSVFVAIKGTSSDGHSYLTQVCDKALAVVVEDVLQVPDNYTGLVYKVESSKAALATLSKNMYSPEIDQLKFYGVTGTNGKTSVTYIVENLFKHLGEVNAVLGTNNHRVGEKIWESQLTTPGALQLHKRLAEMQEYGAYSISMEVSSHALDQKRVDALKYDTAIFTNLSQDHLDYHSSINEYFRAKSKLFTDYLTPDASSIINGDDEFGLKIKPNNGKVLYYGKNNNNDFKFKVIKELFDGTFIELVHNQAKYDFKSPLTGEHNVYNLIAAISAIWSQGYKLVDIISAVPFLPTIPGRLDSIKNNRGLHIFVDYAHTPDALEKVLIVLDNVRKQMDFDSKIYVVFGCGGDRDKTKRPLMFAAANKNSDVCVVTSDNPRTETPMMIINDIIGTKSANEKLIIEVDRKKAIYKALSLCEKNDILLVAGKGHEDYQIIGTKKVQFSDHKVIEEALDVI